MKRWAPKASWMTRYNYKLSIANQLSTSFWSGVFSSNRISCNLPIKRKAKAKARIGSSETTTYKPHVAEWRCWDLPIENQAIQIENQAILPNSPEGATNSDELQVALRNESQVWATYKQRYKVWCLLQRKKKNLHHRKYPILRLLKN